MVLVVLLAVPLVAAALLSRATGRAATAIHAIAATVTSIVAIVVAVVVIRETSVEAFGGFLRAGLLGRYTRIFGGLGLRR